MRILIAGFMACSKSVICRKQLIQIFNLRQLL